MHSSGRQYAVTGRVATPVKRLMIPPASTRHSSLPVIDGSGSLLSGEVGEREREIITGFFCIYCVP